MIHLPKQEEFRGKIVHSSQLEGVDVRGKKVAIIGGGASAVEVLEYAVDQGAKHADILSRVRSSTFYLLLKNKISPRVLNSQINGSSPGTCSLTPSSP
jgi:cation diffusion facilitator CzcD-associated flavoprotein CzcO